MAYKCGGCSKFASVELAEPDVDVEADEEGNITGTASLSLESQCCGESVATAEAEVAGEFALEHTAACNEEEREINVEVDSIDLGDRYEGRKGAPARYQKHFYCADITMTVECSSCHATESLTVTAEEQASAFEDAY